MPRDPRKPFVLSSRLKFKAVIGAVLVHVAIIALLVVSFTVTPEKTAGPEPEIINAVTVDAKQVQQEIDKLRAAERREQQEKERRAREAQQAREREEQRLAKLRAQREKERQQRLAEQRKEKERLAKLEAEKKRLAEERRKEQERLRKLEEQRRAEEERKRKEAEAKRRAEEQRRKEEEQRKKAELEKQLKEKLAAEQQRLAQEQQQLAAAERARQQTVIDKYIELIKAKVRRNWIVPPSARQGMGCVVQVRLLPSGEVVNVQLTQSSGSDAFDRSVEHAVRKASPLPLPPAEQNLFDEFRQLRFPFTLEQTS